eukprot:Gregarina_sp_Poly_1__11524@NODE_99_length_14464_cov_198_334653_g86_i0_p5_GENE_NODE_99_length_14464_cov_198_334653_g86_i0NODE_99_length_14464_cov_198_334653_g86_i0_p5_ORF_typecomplete_len291_score1_23UspA1_rep/PF18792_1/94UspA1_rep/PF18792_1/3_3_NODE_99_length_14464_cov_198_334653_g86_i070537925
MLGGFANDTSGHFRSIAEDFCFGRQRNSLAKVQQRRHFMRQRHLHETEWKVLQSSTHTAVGLPLQQLLCLLQYLFGRPRFRRFSSSAVHHRGRAWLFRQSGSQRFRNALDHLLILHRQTLCVTRTCGWKGQRLCPIPGRAVCTAARTDVSNWPNTVQMTMGRTRPAAVPLRKEWKRLNHWRQWRGVSQHTCCGGGSGTISGGNENSARRIEFNKRVVHPLQGGLLRFLRNHALVRVEVAVHVISEHYLRLAQRSPMVSHALPSWLLFRFGSLGTGTTRSGQNARRPCQGI